MFMDKRDVLSSLVWLSVGLFIILGSLSLEIGTLNNPRSGLFPLIAGSLLSLFALIILIQAVLAKTSEKGSLGKIFIGPNWQKAFYTVGALLIYSIALNTMGFMLITLLLLIFLFRGIEPQKWKVAIGLSLLASVVSYLIFDRILQLQLPRGFLGF
jgi:putative tricarboxylic transport membrane protein